MMSKFRLASAFAVGLAISSYVPESGAVKVVRDSDARPAPAVVGPETSKPEPPPDLPKLTAAQIADLNAKARGGLQTWRAVRTMKLTGRLDAGGKQDTLLPFTLQLKRPNKQRLEVEFAGQTALQVYDGQAGWTYRPYLGRTAPEPFSPDEIRQSAGQQELDGYLIDYAVKAVQLGLDGTEMVEGRPCYRLLVTTKDGSTRRVWVDGSSFLEAKIEGRARRFDGKMREVETVLSDYRSVDGLLIPFVVETRLQGVRTSHKLMIEKAVLNPAIEDVAFGKPIITAAVTSSANVTPAAKK
jgi:outer membrane lipoprotein-sorting protein